MWTRVVGILLCLFCFTTFAGGKKNKKCSKQSAQNIEKIVKQVDEISNASFSAPVRDQFLYMVKSRNTLIPQAFIDKVLVGTGYKTQGFISQKNLDIHSNKHQKEFGLTNQTDYLERAKSFSRFKGDEIISVHQKEGTWGKLNPKTGEYIVIIPNGTQVVTYYKADLKFKNDIVKKYNDSIKGTGKPNKKQYVSLVDWFIDRSLNGPLLY
jgi:hypothetical protein